MTFEEEMQNHIKFFNDYYAKQNEPTITVKKMYFAYGKEWHNWRRKFIVTKLVAGWEECVTND